LMSRKIGYISKYGSRLLIADNLIISNNAFVRSYLTNKIQA